MPRRTKHLRRPICKLSSACQKGASLGRYVVDFLFPHRCFLCEKVLAGQPGLCPRCWHSISFISAPHCKRCGLPFEVASQEDMLCGQCLQRSPLFSYARAVLKYDENSRTLLLKLKYGDATFMAPTLASWLWRSGKDLLAESDALVAVPLHWRRQIARQYNQAALLTQALSKISGHPVLPALKRVKATSSQGHKSPTARTHNVAQAFAVRTPDLIKGKTLVLIDDVFTTGATVEACSKTLLKGGAKAVYVLTLARVLHG